METHTINSEVHISKKGIVKFFELKEMYINTTIEPENELYQTRLIDSKKRTIISAVTTFEEVDNYINNTLNALLAQKFFYADIIGSRKIWKEYCRINNLNL